MDTETTTFEEVTCLACDWSTRDEETLDYINLGLVDSCPQCHCDTWLWALPTGHRHVTQRHGSIALNVK